MQNRSHPLQGQTVLIVGATSSLAQALARSLARRGAHLILAGRDEDELDMLADDLGIRHRAECQVIPADLTDTGFSASRLIAQAEPFDAMIMAAGGMGGEDPFDNANILHTAMLNYVIPAQLLALAASRMEERKNGSLVVISSIAGDRGRKANCAYGSAKAALTCFASGLRNRLSAAGVRVLTVKPGFVDTPMTWGMKSPLIASRERVAESIARAMEEKRDIVYVPWFWRFIMLAIGHIPERTFKKMSL